MTEVYFHNGHRIEPFNGLFICTRCGAVLLTVMQFSATECPKARHATAERGEG